MPVTDPDPLRPALRAVALLFCAFLLFRTLFLEPFGVPTGSMAHALLGNHRSVSCGECGHPVVVGLAARTREGRPDSVRCPNCDHRVRLEGAAAVPGDRVLVDKCVYQLRAPRRWEVAVFHCPVDASKPYVKRVVGLPGESILLRDGDVYAGGELLRKTLAEARECRVPLFDMNHAPPDGWGQRFLVQPVEGAPDAGPSGVSWPDPGALGLADPDGRGVGVTYRNWLPAREFEESLRDWTAYNGPPPEPRRTRPLDLTLPPVHDFFLECEVEIVSGRGMLALRLGDGADHVTADLPIADLGTPRLSARSESPPGTDGPASAGPALSLRPNRRYRLEFAFVDRRASLAVDGAEVVPALDLPVAPSRGGVSRPLQLGVRGAAAVFRNFRLGRDVHYRAEGRWGVDAPHALGPSEYFVLGDNSADSHDSREWAVPGVPAAGFLGKPFLVHQPMRPRNGAAAVDWSRLRFLR